MWPIVFSIQYLCIITWILTSALGLNISLTKTFVPIFFSISIFSLSYNFIKNRLKIISYKYFTILLLLIVLSVIFPIINYFRILNDINVVLYSFIIPILILFCQLCVWILPQNDKSINRIMKVLKLVFIINAIFTITFFLLINIFKIIDLDTIWNLSIQNTVLMKIAGQTWYRTPGIFEIGGTNGTFLLIFLSISISKFYYSDTRLSKSKYFLFISLISILIFFTLTRRTFLCLFLSLFLLILFKTFKQITFLRLIMFIFSLSIMFVGILSISIQFEGIFSLDSFYDRLQFWYMSINNIIGEELINLFIGLGVLQSALNHSIMSIYTYSVLDNGFIEFIMHSGIISTLIFIIYILLLFRDNLKFLNLDLNYKFKWIPLFNILMIINMSILMLFSTFIFNITESFIYLFLINYLTRYVYEISYS